MPPEPKISTAEAILLVFFAIIADVINLIPFINILATIVTFTITQLYFRMKGVKATFNIIMQLLEFIPIVSVLPLTTAGVVVTIIIDHNQKLLGTVIATAGAVVPGGAIAAEVAQKQLGIARSQPGIGGPTSQGEISSQSTTKPQSEASTKPALGKPITTPTKKAA